MILSISVCLAFSLSLFAVAGRLNKRAFPHRRLITQQGIGNTLAKRADACTLGAWQCAGIQLQRVSCLNLECSTDPWTLQNATTVSGTLFRLAQETIWSARECNHKGTSLLLMLYLRAESPNAAPGCSWATTSGAAAGGSPGLGTMASAPGPTMVPPPGGELNAAPTTSNKPATQSPTQSPNTPAVQPAPSDTKFSGTHYVIYADSKYARVRERRYSLVNTISEYFATPPASSDLAPYNRFLLAFWLTTGPADVVSFAATRSGAYIGDAGCSSVAKRTSGKQADNHKRLSQQEHRLDGICIWVNRFVLAAGEKMISSRHCR